MADDQILATIKRLETLETDLAQRDGLSDIRKRVTNIRADMVSSELDRSFDRVFGEEAAASRFEYEMQRYKKTAWDRGMDYETLQDAIEDMAADGWRFVDVTDGVAIFERPAEGK
jgi:hypothetical protein